MGTKTPSEKQIKSVKLLIPTYKSQESKLSPKLYFYYIDHENLINKDIQNMVLLTNYISQRDIQFDKLETSLAIQLFGTLSESYQQKNAISQFAKLQHSQDYSKAQKANLGDPEIRQLKWL